MRQRLLYYLRAFLLIVVLMAGCSAVTTLALDALCYNVLSQRLPIYPGAEITLERYSFLRRFGMGETIMILESADEYETVRNWYSRASASLSMRVRQDNTLTLFYSFTRAAASVTRAEDGTGSQIVLSGACAAG